MKADRPDHFSPSVVPGSGPTPPPQDPNATAAAAAGMLSELPPFHGASPGYGTTGPVGSSQHGGGGDNTTASSFPEEYKKEGNDWFAILTPKVKRVLDVTLAHSLMHERCVCMRVVL